MLRLPMDTLLSDDVGAPVPLLILRTSVRSLAALQLEILALRHQLENSAAHDRSGCGHRTSAPASLATWRMFLRNHVGQIVAADFFVVPTVTYRLLFVLVLLAHNRRRIRHVAVTAHPTAAWTASQLREAFPWDEAPRFLIHDRNHAFDRRGPTAKAMGTEDMHTAPRAPWQNAFVERLKRSLESRRSILSRFPCGRLRLMLSARTALARLSHPANTAIGRVDSCFSRSTSSTAIVCEFDQPVRSCAVCEDVLRQCVHESRLLDQIGRCVRGGSRRRPEAASSACAVRPKIMPSIDGNVAVMNASNDVSLVIHSISRWRSSM